MDHKKRKQIIAEIAFNALDYFCDWERNEANADSGSVLPDDDMGWIYEPTVTQAIKNAKLQTHPARIHKDANTYEMLLHSVIFAAYRAIERNEAQDTHEASKGDSRQSSCKSVPVYIPEPGDFFTYARKTGGGELFLSEKLQCINPSPKHKPDPAIVYAVDGFGNQKSISHENVFFYKKEP